MIEVRHISLWGWEHAIRGMRNPWNSWDKSDSYFDIIGEKDLELMHKLYKAGSDHRKYLRQIFISMDVTAPLYWWKEFDQMKVGTVTNSCSTMHTIHKKPFTFGDFSYEHLSDRNLLTLSTTIRSLNISRNAYLLSNDKDDWWQLVQLLPSSYNQKRTLTMSYENVMAILNQRSNHKLDEWREFCNILRSLPYVNEIRDDKN